MLLNENDCAINQKPPRPRSHSGSSDRKRSSRSSLVIVHEDGTTEENMCDVTSLGFSTVDNQPLTIVEIDNINSELDTKSNKRNVLDVERYENKESQSDNVDTLCNTLSTTVSSLISSLSPTSPIIYEAASNNARPMEASSIKSGHSVRESVMENSRIGKNKVKTNNSGSSRNIFNSSWEVIDRDVDKENEILFESPKR